ncbi:hypothetical protein SLEP1_g41530 [Rubroshorea leprosula]|uniref:Uncharacterized protein n=1 Tax=Rubroshorea leprosula TaxID=152421 RepID=A0AAV5L7C6_9ROSI|nr:hypothetical protein SLEP1_g41530 [Rubroshorea leprosula]
MFCSFACVPVCAGFFVRGMKLSKIDQTMEMDVDFYKA